MAVGLVIAGPKSRIGQPTHYANSISDGASDTSAIILVLSDGFELVSAGTVMLPFNPHKVGATQREQQHGLT